MNWQLVATVNSRFELTVGLFQAKLTVSKNADRGYNFARIHKTLRVTPAMEAGITDHVWTIEEMVDKVGQN